MIKVRGKIEEVADEGVAWLFSVNCNGIGLQSSGKIEQIKKGSKLRKIDVIMISSLDVI